MKQIRFCIVFFLCAGISLRAQETSRVIPFDNVVTTLHPLTHQELAVQLWDSNLGGLLLYSEGHPQIKVDLLRRIDFLFGSGTPNGLDPLDFPSGSSRYVDVVDSNGKTVLPARLPLLAVAFALSPGPQGPTGPQGTPGPPGPPGPGSVTQVNSGPGIIGGPITTTGTLSLDTSLTNSLYARLGAPNIFSGDQAINGNFGARSVSSGDRLTLMSNLNIFPYAGGGSPAFTIEADSVSAGGDSGVSKLSLVYGSSGIAAAQISTNTLEGAALEVDCAPLTDCYGLQANGASKGVFASGTVGITASSTLLGGTAGEFRGDVNVSGTITKGAGGFKIDHPLDPANKYLTHSFVESSDMMNIYNGTTLLDGNGEAWITLPDWFEALNHAFRYQLTAIGVPSPNLYVAEEVSANRFKIAGGQPGAKVSWQVTGIRHDAYADAHRLAVEEDKPEEDRGYYLHPEIHGQPVEKSIFHKRLPLKMHADVQRKQHD